MMATHWKNSALEAFAISLLIIAPLAFSADHVTSFSCGDGYGLNYTLPMRPCRQVAVYNLSTGIKMVQTIPKLIPRPLPAAAAGSCARQSRLGIPPGFRICRIPDCKSNPCLRGWCEETMTSYLCHCPPVTSGRNCEQDLPETTEQQSTSAHYSQSTLINSSNQTSTPSITTSQPASTSSIMATQPISMSPITPRQAISTSSIATFKPATASSIVATQAISMSPITTDQSTSTASIKTSQTAATSSVTPTHQPDSASSITTPQQTTASSIAATQPDSMSPITTSQSIRTASITTLHPTSPMMPMSHLTTQTATSRLSPTVDSTASYPTTTATQASTVPMSKATPHVKPQAHYIFEDNARDTSGNSHHGTVIGPVKYAAGVCGKAAAFNGSTKITVDSLKNYPWGTNFSVSVWFKRTGQFEKYQGIVNNGYNTFGGWEIRMGLENNGRSLGGSVFTNDVGVWDYLGFIAETNAWHHVAMTYDGVALLYYFDGVRQAVQNPDCCVGPIIPRDNPVTIGQAGVGKNDEFFYGLIDEIRIYDTTISESEVQDLYNTPCMSITWTVSTSTLQPTSPKISTSPLTTQPSKTPTSQSTAAGESTTSYPTTTSTQTSTGPMSTATPRVKPQAHYTFEDNAMDTSGNDHHGTTTGPVQYEAGVCGQAASFKGSSKVTVDSLKNYEWGTAFSVSVWFKHTGELDTFEGIVNNGYGTNGGWEIRMGRRLNYETGKIHLGGAIFTNADPDWWDYKLFMLQKELNAEWKHVVMTYDGAALRYFLNGAPLPLFNNLCCTGPIITRNLPVTIGQAGSDISDQYFNGLIDEVKIYDTTISESEVQKLYNTPCL